MLVSVDVSYRLSASAAPSRVSSSGAAVLMARQRHPAAERCHPATTPCCATATGRALTSRGYDHLWHRIGQHSPGLQRLTPLLADASLVRVPRSLPRVSAVLVSASELSESAAEPLRFTSYVRRDRIFVRTARAISSQSACGPSTVMPLPSCTWRSSSSPTSAGAALVHDLISVEQQPGSA